MCQLVAVSTPSQHSQLHANQIVSGTRRSAATRKKKCLKCANVFRAYGKKKHLMNLKFQYLEGELLIEDRVEGLPVDLGLKLLLLVRQQVDLHVRVGCAAHVHGRQLCRLDDPHYELQEKMKDRKMRTVSNCPEVLIIVTFIPPTSSQRSCTSECQDILLHHYSVTFKNIVFFPQVSCLLISLVIALHNGGLKRIQCHFSWTWHQYRKVTFKKSGSGSRVRKGQDVSEHEREDCFSSHKADN